MEIQYPTFSFLMDIITKGSYGAHHAGPNPSAGIPTTTPSKWRPFVAPGKLCCLVDTEQLDEFWPFCNFSKRFYYLNRYLMNVIRRSEAVNDEAKYHKVKNAQKCQRESGFSIPSLRSILEHSSLLRSTNGGHMLSGEVSVRVVLSRDPKWDHQGGNMALPQSRSIWDSRIL